jgi:hypothetical protein
MNVNVGMDTKSTVICIILFLVDCFQKTDKIVGNKQKPTQKRKKSYIFSLMPTCRMLWVQNSWVLVATTLYVTLQRKKITMQVIENLVCSQTIFLFIKKPTDEIGCCDGTEDTFWIFIKSGKTIGRRSFRFHNEFM